MTNQDDRYRLPRGANGNGLALPDREGLRRLPVPCLVAVCWQTVKPCHQSGLAVWLDRGSGLPVASITLQPDRQGQDSSR